MCGTLKRQVHHQENGPVYCGVFKQCCSWFIVGTTHNIKDDLNDIIQNESGQRIRCVLFNMIAVSVRGGDTFIHSGIFFLVESYLRCRQSKQMVVKIHSGSKLD